MGKRGKRHVRMSSAAAAAQAGGASMTTAETMHAFKHAMAHSLGPAPAPSAPTGLFGKLIAWLQGLFGGSKR